MAGFRTPNSGPPVSPFWPSRAGYSNSEMVMACRNGQLNFDPLLPVMHGGLRVVNPMAMLAVVSGYLFALMLVWASPAGDPAAQLEISPANPKTIAGRRRGSQAVSMLGGQCG